MLQLDLLMRNCVCSFDVDEACRILLIQSDPKPIAPGGLRLGRPDVEGELKPRRRRIATGQCRKLRLLRTIDVAVVVASHPPSYFFPPPAARKLLKLSRSVLWIARTCRMQPYEQGFGPSDVCRNSRVARSQSASTTGEYGCTAEVSVGIGENEVDGTNLCRESTLLCGG